MICVECGRPVNDVYKEFGRGTGNIRLTRCDSCHKIADKYVEYELVIVFLDLFLHRPQAYRHMLFNRMEYREHGIDLQYIKVLVVYLFFEVYMKWKLESQGLLLLGGTLGGGGGGSSSGSKAQQQQQQQQHEAFYYYGYWQDHLPHDRYWFILLAAIAEFTAYAIGIALAVRLTLASRYAILKYNYLLMAIILSSFGKGLLILSMIWVYPAGYPFALSSLLNAFVLSSNVVALKVFLDTSTLKAILYVACGVFARTIFQSLMYLLDHSIFV